MDERKLSDLVGKSFEELSSEEMQLLQGAGNVEPDSTPTVIPISTVEVSVAVSGLISASVAASISYVLSKAGKCTK